MVIIETKTKTSVCHLNFINTPSFDDQDLIDIDGVGMMLVCANREYIKTHPTSDPDDETHPILDVVRCFIRLPLFSWISLRILYPIVQYVKVEFRTMIICMNNR